MIIYIGKKKNQYCTDKKHQPDKQREKEERERTSTAIERNMRQRVSPRPTRGI
jgi:hypothetical protein